MPRRLAQHASASAARPRSRRVAGDPARPLRQAPGASPGPTSAAGEGLTSEIRLDTIGGGHTRVAAPERRRADAGAARLAGVRVRLALLRDRLLRRPRRLPRPLRPAPLPLFDRRADVVARPAEPAQPRARRRADLPAHRRPEAAPTAWATRRCPAAPARSRPAEHRTAPRSPSRGIRSVSTRRCDPNCASRRACALARPGAHPPSLPAFDPARDHGDRPRIDSTSSRDGGCGSRPGSPLLPARCRASPVSAGR